MSKVNLRGVFRILRVISQSTKTLVFRFTIYSKGTVPLTKIKVTSVID